MTKTTPQNEDPETRLRRLYMRSWRRGMKEMDLILGHFAKTRLRDLSPSELDAHEQLMDEPDQDLYAWISGASPTPAPFKASIERILANMSENKPKQP